MFPSIMLHVCRCVLGCFIFIFCLIVISFYVKLLARSLDYGEKVHRIGPHIVVSFVHLQKLLSKMTSPHFFTCSSKVLSNFVLCVLPLSSVSWAVSFLNTSQLLLLNSFLQYTLHSPLSTKLSQKRNPYSSWFFADGTVTAVEWRVVC